MSSRQTAALAGLCGTIVLAGLVAAGHISESATNNAGASDGAAVFASAHSGLIRAPEVIATPIDTPQIASADESGVTVADVAIVNAPPLVAGSNEEGSAADAAMVTGSLPLPAPSPEIAAPSMRLASVNSTGPIPGYPPKWVPWIAPPDECLDAEACIDPYLWAVYLRAPKLDTIKVKKRVKVTLTKKGKTRTVTKTITNLVDEDFTWKDPKAAERARMSLMVYVIGGMDLSFKRKLYRALRAMDDAGLAPAMTSGFRDNYRQDLASGNKASTDSSWHGGSRRGGYGHGLAADLVSANGATRAQRWISSELLWKWIDAHGREFGIGRPYLDRDPPHVGPIDGREYVEKRGLGNRTRVASQEKKHHSAAVRGDRRKTKPVPTLASKVSSI